MKKEIKEIKDLLMAIRVVAGITFALIASWLMGLKSWRYWNEKAPNKSNK